MRLYFDSYMEQKCSLCLYIWLCRTLSNQYEPPIEVKGGFTFFSLLLLFDFQVSNLDVCIVEEWCPILPNVTGNSTMLFCGSPVDLVISACYLLFTPFSFHFMNWKIYLHCMHKNYRSNQRSCPQWWAPLTWWRAN